MLWVVLSSCAKGLSGFGVDSWWGYYLKVAVTFLAMLSSLPNVARLDEGLGLVEIMD